MAFSPDQALNLLDRAWRNGRLAHAFLISGPAVDDLERVAAGLAGLVNRWSPAATWDDLRRHGAIVLEPQSKLRRIRIDQIREIEQRLSLTGTADGRKLAVVTEADRLTDEAANAFLKTLEEPSDGTLIVLTTRAPEQLLETIRSRCVWLPLFRSADRGVDLTPEQNALLDLLGSHFADGGKSGALRLQREFQRMLDGIREAIAEVHAEALRHERDAYGKTTDGGWLQDRADHYEILTISRYQEERNRLVATLFTWLGEILRRQQGLPPLDLPDHAAVLTRMAKQFAPADLHRRLRAIEDLRRNLATTVREPLALEAAFLQGFAPA